MIAMTLGNLFDYTGTASFVLCFAFTFYVLAAYKWSATIAFLVQPEREYNVLIVFIWLTLGFKILGVLLKLYMQTEHEIFVIDWEESGSRYYREKRRTLIANEWYKLATVKGFSVQFGVLFLLFLVDGLDLQRLSSPIATDELIWTGKSYQIIRFGLSSFIWLLSMFGMWVGKRFIYWELIANPFVCFVDLCGGLNVSVVLKSCHTHGYYIHGRRAPTVVTEGDSESPSSTSESTSSTSESPEAASKSGIANTITLIVTPPEPDLAVPDTDLAPVTLDLAPPEPDLTLPIPDNVPVRQAVQAPEEEENKEDIWDQKDRWMTIEQMSSSSSTPEAPTAHRRRR
jgi:hypothetical protein